MNPEKFPFEVVIGPGYATFKVSGAFDRERAVELLRTMADAFREHPEISRCVADFREAELVMSDLDRFEIATQTVAVLGSRKLATVARMEKVRNRLYENTTNNRGLENLVTGDMDEALRWLME